MRTYVFSPVAAALGASALSSIGEDIYFPDRIGPGVANYRQRNSGSIAKLNRNTGQPHEHKREIARRLRQSRVQS